MMETEASSGVSILAVDDERSLLKLLARVLEKQGYEVACAPDASSGIETFRALERELDLVFLDVNIPPRGVGELFDEILERRPDIAVILSSGEPLSDALEERLDQCRGIYLRKPFKPKVMLDRVRELCERGSRANGVGFAAPRRG